MSLLLRNSFRTAARSFKPRNYSTPAGGTEDYATHLAHLRSHAKDTTDLWRKISYYVCFPGVAVCVAWVYNAEVEHAAHTEHLREENGGHLPEIPDYEYMNKRVKPFPWGANSLFFNPHVQKDLSESSE